MKKIREKNVKDHQLTKLIINQNWTSVLQGQLASSLVQNEVRRTLVGSWSWYLAHGNSVRPWNFSLQWIMNNALVGHPWTSHLDAIDSPFKLVHFKGRVNHLTAIFWEHKPSSRSIIDAAAWTHLFSTPEPLEEPSLRFLLHCIQ